MLIAIHKGKRKRAEQAGSGAIGFCPWTNYKVKAKVGELRQYWAYDGEKPILPEGYENETEWHYNWKFLVKDEYCEVVCGANNEHRADIVGSKDTVIEIQKSPIDIRIVKERIRFYKEHSNKRMIWVVDASEYWNTRLKPDFDKRQGKNYPVTWKPIRSWVVEMAKNTDTNLFFDFNSKNDKLFQMWQFQGQLWGKFILKTDFFESYLSSVAKSEYKNNPDNILEII